MTLNQLSSGDLIADRRADYAKMLADGGEPGSAAELMAQALERAPDWAAGWFRLADYEEKSGRKEAAKNIGEETKEAVHNLKDKDAGDASESSTPSEPKNEAEAASR